MKRRHNALVNNLPEKTSHIVKRGLTLGCLELDSVMSDVSTFVQTEIMKLKSGFGLLGFFYYFITLSRTYVT